MAALLDHCRLASTASIIIRSASSLNANPLPLKGRYEWWKDPVYVRPVTSPLARGPDFSHLDGRRPRITNHHEWLRRKEQVALAEQVVKHLVELRDAEGMRERESKQRDESTKRADSLRLNVKGNVKFS